MKLRIPHLLIWCWAVLSLASVGLAQTNDTKAIDTNAESAPVASSSRPKLNISDFPAPDAPTLEQETNGGIPPIVQAANMPRTNATARPAIAASSKTNAATAATNQPLVVGPDMAPHPMTPVEASIAAFTNRTPLSVTHLNGVTNSVPVRDTNEAALVSAIEDKITLAREERHQKDLIGAAKTLEMILTNQAPNDLLRQALFERALVAQDDGEPVKAQQIWNQYLHLYSDDPSVPDVLLRQGILYRDMGVHTLAINKFYAVMSSALKIQFSNMDYYKMIVDQAQMEIAQTYFLDGRFQDSAELYNRIILSAEADQNREPLDLQLIRAMSHLTNTDDYTATIARAQTFIGHYPKSTDIPEVRFMLAQALTQVSRNQDSMMQVRLLLQAEQANVEKAPETWLYWQRRAGNEIANQLYKQGDYVNALQIYLSLADIDKSAEWQIPVWYQTALDYEQLQQWQLATDTYTQIIDRQKDLTSANNTPMLSGVIDMAKWRRDYIAWQVKAHENNLALHLIPSTTNAVPVPAH